MTTLPAVALGARAEAPISVGIGLDGAVDEVVVWSTALTATEVAAAMTCAPTADLTDVVAYAAFNERAGAPTSAVYSAACGLEAHDQCPRAIINANTTIVTDGTPLTGGFGVVSAARSVVGTPPPNPIPAGGAEYRVLARDVCGFRHTSGDATIDATTVRLVQVHEGPASISMTTNAGAGYPLTVVAKAPAATPPASMLGGVARCPGMSGDPTVPTGDLYIGSLPLTDAGVYDFTLRANGAAFPGYPKRATVEPSGVAQFELAAPAVLPAAHSVSIRLRAFDAVGNVIEAPTVGGCLTPPDR